MASYGSSPRSPLSVSPPLPHTPKLVIPKNTHTHLFFGIACSQQNIQNYSHMNSYLFCGSTNFSPPWNSITHTLCLSHTSFSEVPISSPPLPTSLLYPHLTPCVVSFFLFFLFSFFPTPLFHNTQTALWPLPVTLIFHLRIFFLICDGAPVCMHVNLMNTENLKTVYLKVCFTYTVHVHAGTHTHTHTLPLSLEFK